MNITQSDINKLENCIKELEIQGGDFLFSMLIGINRGKCIVLDPQHNLVKGELDSYCQPLVGSFVKTGNFLNHYEKAIYLCNRLQFLQVKATALQSSLSTDKFIKLAREIEGIVASVGLIIATDDKTAINGCLEPAYSTKLNTVFLKFFNGSREKTFGAFIAWLQTEYNLEPTYKQALEIKFNQFANKLGANINPEPQEQKPEIEE